MSVSNYKKWMVMASVVALTVSCLASFAMANDRVVTLSDSVQAAAYEDNLSGAPPMPIADPMPNSGFDTATAGSGTATIGSGDCEDGCYDLACDSESCGKSYVLGSELGKFLRCCPEPNGVFVRADSLLWWTKGGRVPALVTTSTSGDQGGGIIGSPYTRILYGNQNVDLPMHSGIRTTGGFLFDCGRAIEFDYLTLGYMNDRQTFGSDGTFTPGNPLIARPLVNNATGQNAAQQIAGDDGRGWVRVNQSEFFQSYGVWFRRPICCPCPTSCCDDPCSETCDDGCGSSCTASPCAIRPRAWRVDFLGGWRNYRLEERTTIDEHLVVVDQPPYIPGSTFDITDRFETENSFNGADLGLNAQLCRGRWTFDLLAKVALGCHVQRAKINGWTDINDTIETEHYTRGLLALPSNIDMTPARRDRFNAIPEFGAEVSYQLTKYLRATAGYHFIYWSNVVRSGELIDLNVDMAQIPPPTGSGTRPTFSWNESDYWAHGLNLGLEARF